MGTQIASKNSSAIVLESRVGYFKGMEGIVAGGAVVVSNILTFLCVAFPLSYVPGWTDPASILMGVAVGTGIPYLGGKYWNAYQVKDVLYEYTGTVENSGKESHLLAAKTFVNSILPFGQTVKTGSKVVNARDEPSDLIGGGSSRNSYFSYGSEHLLESYKADTYIKFTPFGSKVRQVISPTPVTVWDEAFTSTVSVHDFEDEKVLTSSKKR